MEFTWWESLDSGIKNRMISTMFVLYNQAAYDADGFILKASREDHIKNKAIIKEKELTIDKLISELVNKVETSNNETNLKFDSISDSLNKLNPFKNSDKGLIGESIVDNIINKRWAHDNAIVDTSREKGKGDRIVSIDGTDIIIECKNLAQTSLYSSLGKYKKTLVNDIATVKETDGITVGILCNVSSANFRCGDKLIYHMENTHIGKVFIICVTDVESNPFILKAAVNLACVMSELIKNNEFSQNNDILNVIHDVFPKLNQLSETVINNTKLLENLKKNNKIVRNSVEHVIDSMRYVINPEMKDTTKNKLNCIVDFYKKLNDPKITLQLFKEKCLKNNIDISVVRKFGFRKIKEFASG